MLERPRPKYTERIIQFGTGNFLRGFFDWQIDLLNEQTDLDAGIIVLKSTDSKNPSLNTQDGLYTVITRGLGDEGEVIETHRLITSVNRQLTINDDYQGFLELAHDLNLRFITSNTTEAGIVYDATASFDSSPKSFPANLARLLYERYKISEDDANSGFRILPCELIDNNGAELKKIVLRHADDWGLGEGFRDWLEHANTFYSTLVDQIVTGYPEDAVALQEKLGYKDALMTVVEPFYFVAIEGPQKIKEDLRLEHLAPNVVVTDDITPYKQRKVGLLNAAHTSLVPVAYLAGIDTVREAAEDPMVGAFLTELVDKELIPSLDLPEDDLRSFADAVLSRFKNPFIEHALLDISLNSSSKVVARLLPRLKRYQEKFGTFPRRLVFALAAQLYFYRRERKGETFAFKDDERALEAIKTVWLAFDMGELTLEEVAQHLLREADLWRQELAEFGGLVALVGGDLETIHQQGMRAAIAQL